MIQKYAVRKTSKTMINQEGVIMQVKVAGSMPKRRVSFEERYFIEPMEVVLSRCVCVKEKT